MGASRPLWADVMKYNQSMCSYEGGQRSHLPFFRAFPSYLPEFPNLVVIKGLVENVWTPSSSPPRRTAASLNALVCCQPSTAVLSCYSSGPHQPAEATVAGVGSPPAGSIQCQMTRDEMKGSTWAFHGLLLQRPGRTTPGDMLHWEGTPGHIKVGTRCTLLVLASLYQPGSQEL